MTIPWLTRLPTPEEVAEHAKAHPVDEQFGLWLYRVDDWHAITVLLGVELGSVVNISFNAPDEDPGARWLPCTAEGIPVCLAPAEPAAPNCADDEPECPGEDCKMCNGEACNKCGAGCWDNRYPPERSECEHDVTQRHEEPECMRAEEGPPS